MSYIFYYILFLPFVAHKLHKNIKQDTIGILRHRVAPGFSRKSNVSLNLIQSSDSQDNATSWNFCFTIHKSYRPLIKPSGHEAPIFRTRKWRHDIPLCLHRTAELQKDRRPLRFTTRSSIMPGGTYYDAKTQNRAIHDNIRAVKCINSIT